MRRSARLSALAQEADAARAAELRGGGLGAAAGRRVGSLAKGKGGGGPVEDPFVKEAVLQMRGLHMYLFLLLTYLVLPPVSLKLFQARVLAHARRALGGNWLFWPLSRARPRQANTFDCQHPLLPTDTHACTDSNLSQSAQALDCVSVSGTRVLRVDTSVDCDAVHYKQFVRRGASRARERI